MHARSIGADGGGGGAIGVRKYIKQGVFDKRLEKGFEDGDPARSGGSLEKEPG